MTPRRPTYGFLAAGLDEAYQITIREGLLEGVSENGGRLVSLPGIPAFSEELGDLRNPFTRDLVSGEVFDGLIVLASTFIGYLDQEEILGFCRKFAPIPLISVGLQLPGIPSIRIDNGRGMEELTEHLVSAHGCRKPVLLGGLWEHPEAREREEVFRRVLERHGIVPDERLMTRSSFFVGNGEVTMKKILAQGIPFDSVVCANDTMAMEALAVLDGCDRFSPERCLLTGFDDIPPGAREPFSLTTVHQPLHEMGILAARMIRDLAGGGIPEDIVLPSRIVVRRSCGCSGPVSGPTAPEQCRDSVRIQQESKRFRLLRMTGIRLMRALDRDAIRRILATSLRDLETGHVAVSVIPEEYRGKPDKKAVPFHYYDPGGYNTEPKRFQYPLTRFYPPEFPEYEVGSCLACPLNFGEETLGYIIFEEKPGILEVYHSLSLQLANAIKVWELEQKRQNHTRELETRIGERTAELREEVERRAIAEHKALVSLQDRIRLEQEVLAAAEREQRRIGQDLHDDICQRLAGLAIDTATLESLTGPGPAREQAEELSRKLRDILGSIKALSRGLFPVILDSQGLAGALTELAGILSGQLGPEVVFLNEGDGDGPLLPYQVRLQLYRIAQEAAHNAVKHSRGSRIVLSLQEEDAGVTVTVSDNGRGFPIPAKGSGLGISSMGYRAGMIGARLELESSSEGTVMRCRWSGREEKQDGP